MRVWFIILLLLSRIWAEEISAKMILSSHTKSEEAAKSLYEIELFFKECKECKDLKDKYKLEVTMEILDKYILIVVSPINQVMIKNKLQLLWKEKFPESFLVIKSISSEISTIRRMHDKFLVTQGQKYKEITQTKQIKKSFWYKIDWEWVGLYVLAFIGLLLVYRSAKQISEIKKLQKEIAKYQIILEKELDSLEVKHG